MKNSLTMEILILFLAATIAISGCGEQEKAICGNNICDEGENSAICPADCGAQIQPEISTEDPRTGVSPMGPSPPKQVESLKYTIPWYKEYVEPCYAIVSNAAQDRSLYMDKPEEYYGITGSVSGYGNCAGKMVGIIPDLPKYNLDGSENLGNYKIPIVSYGKDGKVEPTQFKIGYFKGFGEALCTSVGAYGEGVIGDDAIVTIRAAPKQSDCERYGKCQMASEGTCYSDMCITGQEVMDYCDLKKYIDYAVPYLTKSANGSPALTEGEEPSQQFDDGTVDAFFADAATPSLEPLIAALNIMDPQIESFAAQAANSARAAQKFLNRSGQNGGGIQFDFTLYNVVTRDDGEPLLKSTKDQITLDYRETISRQVDLSAPQLGHIDTQKKTINKLTEELAEIEKQIADAGKTLENIDYDDPLNKAWNAKDKELRAAKFTLTAFEKELAQLNNAAAVLKERIDFHQNQAKGWIAAKAKVENERETLIRDWIKKVPSCKTIVARYGKYAFGSIGLLLGLSSYKAIAQDVSNNNYSGATSKTIDLMIPGVVPLTEAHGKATAEVMQFYSKYDELKKSIDSDLKNTYWPDSASIPGYDLRTHGGGKCDSSIGMRAKDLYEKEYQDYLKWERESKEKTADPVQ